MAEFKPMVKMMTDEPSVILKLKKGGHVHTKAHAKAEHGHAPMHKMAHHAVGGSHDGAEEGHAPKKPSMADRRKAMNPNLYAKGGKVHHKLVGGAMPMAAAPAAAQPAAAPMISPAALARARQMIAARKAALMGQQGMGAGMPAAAGAGAMKKGGKAHHAEGGKAHHAEMAELHKLEKELKHHESMHAAKAHHGLKHGGKAHKVHKADGGEIDRYEARDAIEGNEGKFAKTKMDTSKRDTAHGTGEVKEGKPGGYKHGGHAKHHSHHEHFAHGGKVHHKHHKALGGTIEGNEGPFERTKMVEAKRDTVHGTGGVKEGNGGGYKHGGHAHRKHHKAAGGAIEGNEAKFAINNIVDGDKHDPAHGTGEVRESNGGGYKHGGHAKKAYATGGNVVDDGRAVKMPRKPVSRPVANSLQSGTFKKGGKVKHHFADGGYTDYDSDQPTPTQLRAMQAELAARKQQEANDTGYATATQPQTDPGILGRIKSALGYKHGGKMKR